VTTLVAETLICLVDGPMDVDHSLPQCGLLVATFEALRLIQLMLAWNLLVASEQTLIAGHMVALAMATMATHRDRRHLWPCLRQPAHREAGAEAEAAITIMKENETMLLVRREIMESLVAMSEELERLEVVLVTYERKTKTCCMRLLMHSGDIGLLVCEKKSIVLLCCGSI